MSENYIDKINISGVNYNIKDSNSYTKEESNDIFVSKSQLDILNVEEDGFFIDSLNSNLLYPFVHFLTGDEIMNNGNYPWLPIADLVTGYNPHKEDYGNCAEGYDDSIKINE